LAGIGTKGDILPLLGLGAELARRGFACDLLGNRGYESLAQSHGLGFRAVTCAQINNLVSGRENLDAHVFPSYEPTFEYFAEQLARREQLLVINLDHFSASNLMAERHGLPLCRVSLAPSAFRSLQRPAYPLSEKLRGPLAHTYRRYVLPQLYARQDADPFVLGRINPYRVRQGLPERQLVSQLDAPVQQRLGFFPPWFGTPQPDWPQPLQLVGFPLPPPRSELPPGLASFLDREGAPLVFTPGTGVVDVAQFFDDARHCCEQLGRPGVFLSPHCAISGAGASERIFRAPFVELEPLLRRSALLVHHGGIGTTARALQAGIPQIIRGAAYDQPDNGDRVRELGVGSLCPPGPEARERLVQAALGLLDNPQVQESLAALRSELVGSDALAAAARQIEQLVAREQLALGA
jgi:rhamnosyltransferase subunit B